jgi:uncharacterized protein
MSLSILQQLASRIEQNPGEKGLPPIHAWHPERVLDIGLGIDAQGRWFHQGDPFERTALVRLFSTLLRRDADDEYYLVTPVEKVRVAVAEVPFLIVTADLQQTANTPQISLTSNVSDTFLLDADHPLRVMTDAAGQPRPYVRVRDRLEARILPQVFYQLVDAAQMVSIKGRNCLQLNSCGCAFVLGELDS